MFNRNRAHRLTALDAINRLDKLALPKSRTKTPTEDISENKKKKRKKIKRGVRRHRCYGLGRNGSRYQLRQGFHAKCFLSCLPKAAS